nr:response regulator [candidate division Zixibacteria bacterium]
MENKKPQIKLLFVDDEDDFRQAAARTLGRRGFIVTEAADGQEALGRVKQARPDIVVLDLKMPGMSGIETLQKLREFEENLPVLILTGHGDFDSAMAGIKLEIVDFLQKPVDMEQLGDKIRVMLDRGRNKTLRERTIFELMVPPAFYPRVYDDEPMTSVLEELRKAFYRPVPEGVRSGQVRSALVFSRKGEFRGIIRFNDLLKLLIPPSISHSPYASFFTGMFLAQCKVIGQRFIGDLVDDQAMVAVDASLMEAIHLMDEHHLINIAVMRDNELVGVLRGRDIILEVADCLGSV